MNEIQAIILGVIEGLTEFLPISSTGHIIIGSSIMGIQHLSFTKLFTITIQLGTILSVLVVYHKRFFQSIQLYYKIFLAFIPAVFLGLLLSNTIDVLLENNLTVGIMLILGGIILFMADKWWLNDHSNTEPSYAQSIKIGFYQCFAMLPGVSRSAASIIGGMSLGLNRTAAAEFSFFLAVPTMLGATCKKLFDYYQDGYSLNQEQIKLLLIGNVLGFIVAIIAIKTFIGLLSKYGFKWWGIYRIMAGIFVLIYFKFR